MRGLLTGIGIGLAIVGLAFLGWLRWLDGRVAETLGRRYDVALAPIVIPSDSPSVAEGKRLAHIVGCHGCHGEQLQGRVVVDQERVMRVVAPNVSTMLRLYSDAELARLIRHGIRRDGTGVLVMPAASYVILRDADVARVVAWLRTVPAAATTLPGSELGLPAKLAVLKGALLPSAAAIDHRARPATESDAQAADTAGARGAYLARAACTECHGLDLHGALEAPPLVAANGYSEPEFVSLLLDGRSRDGRDLPTMTKTARERFASLTSDEISSIYRYLRALPAGERAPAITAP